MKNSFLKSSCLILLVVVAFVYFANPIYAKASTADMDYVETDMTTSEVAQLFAVPAAFLPAALVIIGFIVLTYCTLRNVQVPVSYPSQASFLDKCTQLGQYVVDNITDPIKDFLYSVYTYCEDNNLTSITGIAAFTALHIGKFFHAIGQWINGSLINNVSEVGSGLLNEFVASSNFSVPFSNHNISLFNSYSDIPVSSCLAFNSYYDPYYNNVICYYYSGSLPSDVFCLTFSNGFGFYRLVNNVFVFASDLTSIFLCSNLFHVMNPSTVTWSYNNFVVNSTFNFTNYYFEWLGGSSLTSLSESGLSLDSFVSMFPSRYIATGSVRDNVLLSDTTLVADVVTPWSDQIYEPSDDELEVDPDGIGEVLGGAVAGLTLGELINLLTQGKTLTLDSALESQKIVGGGDYVFPSMDGIWKYPQYFFDILKGWGSFVGGCLSAVTVGDGGLSWIFYGGFVLLICGGIIGKILLG